MDHCIYKHVIDILAGKSDQIWKFFNSCMYAFRPNFFAFTNLYKIFFLTTSLALCSPVLNPNNSLYPSCPSYLSSWCGTDSLVCDQQIFMSGSPAANWYKRSDKEDYINWVVCVGGEGVSGWLQSRPIRSGLSWSLLNALHTFLGFAVTFVMQMAVQHRLC